MKKVEFGYSNNSESLENWQGYGLKEGSKITEANYFGAVKYENDSYVVAKTFYDENFIIRPAIADLYKDGSGIILLDQEKSMLSEKMEKYLNELDYKGDIKNINEVMGQFNGLTKADRSFDFLTMGETIMMVSIPHEHFERKNEILKETTESFSQLKESLIELNNGYRR